jgi:hypothetical protein
MKARAGWREKQQVEHEFAPGAVISGGHPAEDLTDEELMQIIRRGQHPDDPRTPRAGRFAIDVAPEMTAEEWQARYAPKP